MDFTCSGSVVVTAYDFESGHPGSNPEWGLICYVYVFDHCTVFDDYARSHANNFCCKFSNGRSSYYDSKHSMAIELINNFYPLTLGRPGGGGYPPPCYPPGGTPLPVALGATPLPFFPCNFFDDSNRKNRLIVSVTRDGRHILAYVTSSWRCHVTYVMTSNVHDGGQNTLFLPLFVNRDIFWCRWDKVMRLVSFSTKSRS